MPIICVQNKSSFFNLPANPPAHFSRMASRAQSNEKILAPHCTDMAELECSFYWGLGDRCKAIHVNLHFVCHCNNPNLGLFCTVSPKELQILWTSNEQSKRSRN